MLTARTDAEDRIAGLEIGADDYLAKPFEPRELLLRMKNILSRRTEVVAGQTRDHNSASSASRRFAASCAPTARPSS